MLRTIFLLGFLFISTKGFGHIEDHLKIIDERSEIHRMKNIDFIYMINLDERPEKWQFCNHQLNPYGIFPYRFSAVNGWKLTLETINEVGLKYHPASMSGGYLGTSYLDLTLEQIHEPINKEGQAYFCHGMARGTIGIVLSHLSVLRDAILSNYNTIWIMEDDIEVLSNPHELSSLIEKLDQTVGKNNWDILFTDRNSRDSQGKEIPARGVAPRPNFNPKNIEQYFTCSQIDNNFIRLGARFGAYSMILRQSGIKKIYNFIISHCIFHPYDMDFYLPPGLKIYTVVNDIVSNFPLAPSDNGGPNYSQ
jgi:GR25 family glycosyltransferase involved in LPS biosynthesis